jgi:membrane-bound ClpP family serine protease
MSRIAAIWLLVVAVVLGATSAFVVVTVNRATRRSQDTVCTTDAHTIATAVATDRAQHSASDAPTMATLVARGYLVRPSPYHVLSYSGSTLVLRGLRSCAGSPGS